MTGTNPQSMKLASTNNINKAPPFLVFRINVPSHEMKESMARKNDVDDDDDEAEEEERFPLTEIEFKAVQASATDYPTNEDDDTISISTLGSRDSYAGVLIDDAPLQMRHNGSSTYDYDDSLEPRWPGHLAGGKHRDGELDRSQRRHNAMDRSTRLFGRSTSPTRRLRKNFNAGGEQRQLRQGRRSMSPVRQATVHSCRLDVTPRPVRRSVSPSRKLNVMRAPARRSISPNRSSAISRPARSSFAPPKRGRCNNNADTGIGRNHGSTICPTVDVIPMPAHRSLSPSRKLARGGSSPPKQAQCRASMPLTIRKSLCPSGRLNRSVHDRIGQNRSHHGQKRSRIRSRSFDFSLARKATGLSQLESTIRVKRPSVDTPPAVAHRKASIVNFCDDDDDDDDEDESGISEGVLQLTPNIVDLSADRPPTIVLRLTSDVGSQLLKDEDGSDQESLSNTESSIISSSDDESLMESFECFQAAVRH